MTKDEGLIEENLITAALGWLSDHELEPSDFAPDTWEMIRNNLRALKDIAGLTQTEIARSAHNIPNGQEVSGSRRVAITQDMQGSRDIARLARLTVACGFDPMLLFVPNLRGIIRRLAAEYTTKIKLEHSIFRTVKKCPNCDSFNRDPLAKYCSQCGARLS
jgi:hypothetical protein